MLSRLLEMEDGEVVVAVCTLVSDLLDAVSRSDSSGKAASGLHPASYRRKKIRRIQDDQKLSSDTLDARQQELERQERIKLLKGSEEEEWWPSPKEEKPSLPCGESVDQPEIIELSDDDDEIREKPDFTNDEQNRPDVYGRLLINPGHPKDEPDIFLPRHMEGIVKRHQLGGIRFMYENVVETRRRFETSPGFGCILAHSMGLGKTLQVILFVNAVLELKERGKVLIIVPLNTLQNWAQEFERWLPKTPEDSSIKSRGFHVFVLNDTLRTIDQRASLVDDWHKSGGVLLMGYEIFRLLVTSDFAGVNRKKRKKRKRKGEQPPSTEVIDIEEEELHESLAQKMRGALLYPGPDVVVCDEGHRIKNINTATARTLGSVRTRRRVVLTGYPIQNNLMEYWCMVDFVRPRYLGTKAEFANMFERPIKNGTCFDSTHADMKLARLRTHVLVGFLRSFVQRRSHNLLKDILPKKTEYVILLRKSPVQRTLYREFLMYFQGSINYDGACLNPIKAFAICCKIWNHPDILKKFLEKSEKYAVDKDLDLPEAAASKEVPVPVPVPEPSSGTASSSDEQGSSVLFGLGGEGDIGSESSLPCASAQRPDVIIPAKLKSGFGQHSRSLAPNYDWAKETMDRYDTNCLENGYKMAVTMNILKHSVWIGDKVLLFSQSLFTLNLIEEFLSKDVGKTGIQWKRNKNYFRLDGSTSGIERQRLVSRFNNESGIHLFLISTRAGSLGINLVGANRVIVFDASWNPCHDAQAVCRVYRYGQGKECFVYRLVTDNSMERAIFNRQVGKQGISERVVDEKHVDAFVTKEELQNLMTYEEAKDSVLSEWEDTSWWCLDDRLLHEVCAQNSAMLSTEPIKHESLLLDSKEGELTEAEKREAKLQFDEDRKLLRGVPDTARLLPPPSSSHAEYSSAQRRIFSHLARVPPAVAVVRPLQSNPYMPEGSRGHLAFPPLAGSQTSVPLPASHAMGHHMAHGHGGRPLTLPRSSTEPVFGDHLQHRQEQPILHHVLTFAANLPSITYPGLYYPVPAGQMATVVKTQAGKYLRLQDGHVLDARGSPYDAEMSESFIPPAPRVPGRVREGGAVATADGHIRPSCSAGGLIDLCSSDEEDSSI